MKSKLLGLVLATVVALYAAVAASGIARPGYSIDEEYTLFGVRGISAHGFPILPSGALYDRGLPYTYAAWLSGSLFGHGFPAYRLPSLVSGIVVLMLAFKLALLAQRTAGIALVTTAAIAALPWMIFSAQWARFYGMFAAVTLASVLLFHRYVRTGRGLPWWLASIWFAHLLHEFAVLLALLPVVLWMLQDRRVAPFPVRTTALALAAFAASEATVLALHFVVSGAAFRTLHGYAALHALPVGWEIPVQAAPPTAAYPLFDAREWSGVVAAVPLVLIGGGIGAVAAWRLRTSPVLGATHGVLSVLGQFARMWLVGAMWAFSRPRTILRTLIWTAGAVVVAAALLSLTTAWSSGASLSVPLVSGLVAFSLREATAGLGGLTADYPASTLSLAVAAVVLAGRSRSVSVALSRGLLLWVLWWLLAFDVLHVDFKPRYYAPLWLLIALAVIPAARFIPVTWLRRRNLARVAQFSTAVVAAIILSGEQYGVVDENRTAHCISDDVCLPMMLAYNTSSVGAMRSGLRSDDLVFCGDELLCDLELGRADYWLYSGTIFRYPTPDGPIGLYGGAPIVASLQELRTRLLREPAARFWIVIPALRKYSTWTVEEILAALPAELRGRIQVTQTAGATIVAPAP